MGVSVITMIVVNVKKGKIAFGVDYNRIIITGEPENIIKNFKKIIERVEKIDDGLIDVMVLVGKNNVQIKEFDYNNPALKDWRIGRNLLNGNIPKDFLSDGTTGVRGSNFAIIKNKNRKYLITWSYNEAAVIDLKNDSPVYIVIDSTRKAYYKLIRYDIDTEFVNKIYGAIEPFNV